MERLQTSVIGPNPSGDRPRIASSTYTDSSARIIGNVEIGPRSFIGPFAVLRSDEVDETGKVGLISIGEECNVQDGVIMHSLAGQQISVGARVSLAHGCIVHGPCAIGNNSFIGFRSVVFKATVGAGSYVGTGAVIEGVGLPPHSRVPAGMVVTTPETVDRLNKTGKREREFMKEVVEMNMRLAEGYLRQARFND